MKWDKIHISDKIVYLKDIVMNSTNYKDGDEYIINALITGSNNTFSGEMGFNIKPHHMKFMRGPAFRCARWIRRTVFVLAVIVPARK